MPTLSYVHRFVPATAPALPPLLLLHGTGGDEDDLIPLGHEVAPGAALLSPRGDVLEGSAPRFFRRLREGVFDEDDLRLRANALADFVGAARQAYGIAPPVALGYSNGANIAAAMMLLRPEALAGALLMRAMAPFAAPPKPDLAGRAVLILSGLDDPIVSAESAAGLADALTAAGARVERATLLAGHGLTREDLARAKAFYAGAFAASSA
jgi:phospholipase/carboxylesterase